jgi:aminodeoxyfutalosine synthase
MTRRLTLAEAFDLYRDEPLESLMRSAEEEALRRHGPHVTYNINIHVNPTNICEMGCLFCAYHRAPGDAGGWALEIPAILDRVRAAVAHHATEVHMTGGCNPAWPASRYLDIIRALRAAFPALHIKAFTAVEIEWLARRAEVSVPQMIDQLITAGVSSFPGGGAEIFAPRVRQELCPRKIDASTWLSTHRAIHRAGLSSNATMLYGHKETLRERLEHMDALRRLQDETQGFVAFVPLPFLPRHNRVGLSEGPTREDSLRTMAVARLFLDNIPHLKAYWVMLGVELARECLRSGANDLDGTVTEEEISRASASPDGQCLAVSSLRELIRSAGRTPLERDSRHEVAATFSRNPQ